MGRGTLGPGIVVGKDLAYWALALRFAGALVVKQQFLPTMSESSGIPSAHWKPIFLGPDAERLSTLARAMPGAPAPSRRQGTHPRYSGCCCSHRFCNPHGGSPRPFYHRRESVPANHRKQDRAFYDSVHDAWLDALCSPDGVIQTDPAGFNQLSAHIKDWERPVAISSTGPFRLCFRIEEPIGRRESPTQRKWKNGMFAICFRLNHDPSLQIPAKEVWKAKTSLPNEEEFNAREYLLLSLGQASRICSHIEASLRTSTPAGYVLDATGAYEFLTQKALMLEQSGFGVMLPAWWTRKGTKLRLTARANVKAPGDAKRERPFPRADRSIRLGSGPGG